MSFLRWVPVPGAYIAGATVLALPWRDESFSQPAILELAHGVPVVRTDVDGFPATLGDGHGMVPRIDGPGLGLGLPLIAQMAMSSRSVPTGSVVAWSCGCSSTLTARR